MTLPGDAPDLRLGDSTEWVTELQRLLRVLDHLHRDPDGNFDEDTRRAVEEFQAAAGLTADGLVDRETWTALFAASPPEHYGAVEPAFGDHSASGQASEDGQWIWDGERWVGAGDGRPQPAAAGDGDGPAGGDGELSTDRQWRWDGAEWQPAGQ